MARRPSTPAHLWALGLSPLLALLLVGWCRRALEVLPPPEAFGGPPATELALESAVEAAAAAAIADLWGEFDRSVGAREADLDALAAWLAERGLPDGGERAVLAPGTPTGALTLTRTGSAEALSLVLREPTGTPGAFGGPMVWRATQAPFEGAGHVLVGRDVSCTLCHVTLTSGRQVERRDASGARPASAHALVLGDLVLRADARIRVHGTLHLGGGLFDAAGAPLAPEEASNLTFAPLERRGAVWAPARGELAPLEPLDRLRLASSAGTLLGRCRGGTRVTRRPLPVALPRFADVRPKLPAGSAAVVSAAGGLRGGRGGLVPLLAALDPEDSGAPLAPLVGTPGHLWAIGTADQPLVLDGDVTIGGDLVLGGALQGHGTLRAARDIWVVGSLSVDGAVALVAGRDLVAGAAHEAHGSLARFVRAAAPEVAEEPDWISAARLGRMGQRDTGPMALEALAIAARQLVVVAPRGSGSGDVYVRGGLMGDTVAVHAPGELVLEHDPSAHALVELLAPRGLTLRRERPNGTRVARDRPYGLDWTPADLAEVGPNPALR